MSLKSAVLGFHWLTVFAEKLMLSIGKLSHLVHMQETNVLDDDTVMDGTLLLINPSYPFDECIPQAFHDGLDVVSVHTSLIQGFRSCLVAARARQSLDGQLDTILKAKGSILVGRPAFTHVCSEFLLYFTLTDIRRLQRFSVTFSGNCSKGKHCL